MSNVPEQLRYTAEHEYLQATADGAVRILGWRGDIAGLRERSAARLETRREEPAVTG